MESSLKRKDTTKGPPLRILSLDGGGVRGYSIFIILQEIMHRTFVETEGRAPHRNEIPKPADHFDLIVGTGTGGLIALMLGRLRLDIETCKELYVRMTRMVFETDKTILGIPTRPTLFKASRLEDAIKAAVRDHTVAMDEGKDSAGTTNPLNAGSRAGATAGPRRHSSNASVVSFSARSPAAQMAARPNYAARRGDPNALLYDSRDNRTKTVVTAIYKGAPRGEEPVMLRSYDSRHEPAPEFDCRIWEAGRATCAIGLAFKPVQIGQTVFHDDGSGTFNPSPYALDEAAVKEWPGREIGVFVSVGTGKRPRGSDQNNPMWYDGFLGEFAEARRKLISKIEGCEKIHEYMVREHLLKRGVNVENYYRLNVEVGVGEFGMNEWGRLADISTSTKRYLNRPAERSMVQGASAKLAKIQRANIRYNARPSDSAEPYVFSPTGVPAPVSEVFAVELPGDIPTTFGPTGGPNGSGGATPNPSSAYSPRQSYDSGLDRLSVPQPNGSPSPRSSSERFHPHQQRPGSSHPSIVHQEAIAEVPGEPVRKSSPPRQNAPYPPTPPNGVATTAAPSRTSPPPSGSPQQRQKPPRGRSYSTGARPNDDQLLVSAPTPEQWRNASSGSGNDPRRQQTYDHPPSSSSSSSHPQPLYHSQQPYRIEPPPLPPKTPLPDGGRNSSANGHANGNGRPSFSGGRRPFSPPSQSHHAATPSASSAISGVSALSSSSYTGAPMGGAPYPVDDDEAPPPPVNKSRKPEYRRR